MNDKKNMFKKLKSIFIVEDDSLIAKEQEISRNKPKDIALNTPKIEVIQPIQGKSTDIGSLENNKFSDILFKVIEDNNIDGFDYLEFKNSVVSLAKNIPDEGTQYKSAYEVGKTIGLTKNRLLETAQFYADIIKKEETKFSQAFENQRQQQLNGRAEEIKKHEDEIVDFEQRIAQLQQTIEEHKVKINELRTAMNESTEKLAQTHGEFQAAYQNLHNQMAMDIQKINKYIS